MVMRQIKYFLLCFFIFASGIVSAQEDAIKEAESAYTQENYTQAIELYEGILKIYGDSHEIFYNLGNAYFKAGKIAPAILNYERALLMNPGDKDIRFNLEIAKLKKVDRIDPLGEFFVVQWFRTVQNLLDVDTWASIGIACFILLIGCLFLFFFSKWMRLRKTGFYLGIILLCIVICSNIFSLNQQKATVDRKGAIIFAPTVTIKSSPDASGTDLVVLHEGTKVFIKNALGEWYEIELEDGNVGWISQKDLERI